MNHISSTSNDLIFPKNILLPSLFLASAAWLCLAFALSTSVSCSSLCRRYISSYCILALSSSIFYFWLSLFDFDSSRSKSSRMFLYICMRLSSLVLASAASSFVVAFDFTFLSISRRAWCRSSLFPV